MNRLQLWWGICGLLLFAGGFLLGRVSAPAPQASEREAIATVSAAIELGTPPLFPTFDVPGADIEDLPRHPDSRRVTYGRRVVDNLLVTEVQYLVPALPEAVREFYRSVFHQGGWAVADLGYFEGKWTFLVMNEEREAVIGIESPRSLIEVEIMLSEPLTGTIFEGIDLRPTTLPQP
jgi:hypothetical protein